MGEDRKNIMFEFYSQYGEWQMISLRNSFLLDNIRENVSGYGNGNQCRPFVYLLDLPESFVCFWNKTKETFFHTLNKFCSVQSLFMTSWHRNGNLYTPFLKTVFYLISFIFFVFEIFPCKKMTWPDTTTVLRWIWFLIR